MRCKGIPTKSLEKVCKEMFNNDCYELYNSDQTIKFKLNEVKFCPSFQNSGWGGCFEKDLEREITFS